MHHETTRHARADGISVLVVEDEFLIAMDVVMMLEQHGFAVFGSAASVRAALDLLDTGRPDVAMLDMNLRGELVTPVAERLRELDIPFVLASAYQSTDFDGCGSLEGAENVGKPIAEARLVDALRRAARAS
ncbi:response regulator [Citreimonas sp.]|uniref:response regulator n=1 Tax=Citreimonas sp. TaxID=3036715 RepID=UPI0040594504